MNLPEIEKKILKFWQDNKIFEKLVKKNQGKKRWSFLDGPITANNPMGVHHAWGRTYKDVIQRYKAMNGFDLRYQNGFDCQGLWVEVEVEKELGFKTKKDIENFGIEKFVELCKQRVEKYSKIQTEQSIRLGQWMDWDNSYFTMSDENNYAIWSFLKKCREQGLLYKGKDVVPWCIRCGTAISQHEILTEEYKEITHKAIFVKLPVIGEENTYFLVWTTTPWTLPGNVSLAVSPDLEYAEIKNKDNEIFILLKDKAEIISDGEILRTFKGKELEGKEYQGMFDEIEGVKNALGDYKHKVILWKDVTQEEGTGIVHIAPGCGQEDFKLGKELGLPVIDILDDESKYKKEFGFLAEKLATTVRDFIFENLEKKKVIFKIEDYIHRYPTCWRCKQELIFRLVDEWYISMEKIREKLKKVAKDILWEPPFGLDRELDWLENMGDWLISKKRYWGLTLPIFECEKCGNFEVIGSKKELKKRVVEGWEKFEGHSPHRPWLDAVKIKCSKCGEIVPRIKDVGNPWLDAGIAPFSTMGYFENKKHWESWFPADFICESFPGQFKNWFYAIIVMSAVLEGVAPTKTIFGFASVHDENDEEMHKSKGNAIWFDDAVEKIGAETMRWMYVKQNPVLNLRFGWTVAEETRRKLMTLFNTFSFFHIYMKKEEFPEIKDAPKTKNILDKWIVSRSSFLIKKITVDLDNYNFDAASSEIERFFINDLSLWYLRRSRDRFHQGADGRKQAIETFYYILLNLTKIISPILPFLSEEFYQALKTKKMPESVHLCDWPKIDKKLIDNDLEKTMAGAREVVAQVLAQRAEKGIKVRQPLSLLKIQEKFPEEILNIIKDEVNVKEIQTGKEFYLETEMSAELLEEGCVREFIRQVQSIRKNKGLTPNDRISVAVSGEKEIIDIIVKNKDFIAKEVLADNLEEREQGDKFDKEAKIQEKQIKISLEVLK
ncbi:MAG: isoleucine--tRNA ligase [bacterium]|nr:isoleucine--tRNA ligase [bacterium]